MDTVKKPITLLKQEFTEELIKYINDSSLPSFLIEYILRDILNKVHLASIQQLEFDTKKYQEQISKKDEN